MSRGFVYQEVTFLSWSTLSSFKYYIHIYTVHSYHNPMHNFYISLSFAGINKALQKTLPTTHLQDCLQNLQIYLPNLQIVYEIHNTNNEDLWPTFRTSLVRLRESPSSFSSSFSFCPFGYISSSSSSLISAVCLTGSLQTLPSLLGC